MLVQHKETQCSTVSPVTLRGGRGPQGCSFLTHVGGIYDLGSAVPLLRWEGSMQ